MQAKRIITQAPPTNEGAIVLPWAVGLSVFKIHLTHRLMRTGYSPERVTTLLKSTDPETLQFLSKELDAVLDEYHQQPKPPAVLVNNPTGRVVCELNVIKVTPPPQE